MIPNSLRIALAVGMLGGIAAAVILAEVRTGQEVRHADGPSLTLLTDKADYRKGEPVMISLVNSGNTKITFTDSSYNTRITGLAGMPIHHWVSGDEAPVLNPGQRTEMIWDQKKTDGEQVFDGVYRISSVGYYDGDNGWGSHIEVVRTINIYEMDLTFGS